MATAEIRSRSSAQLLLGGQFHLLIAVLNDGTELRVGRTYTAAIRARLARRD